MLIATQGLVLHTTPYAESSVVAKVFTRQLGVRSYVIKGVRGRSGKVKQNLLQPLSSLDMVVYDNHRKELNYIKEMSPRHPQQPSDPVTNALRFFMTEVLYKALREGEPMPELWDYVEQTSGEWNVESGKIPVLFLLRVAHFLGIEPMDNHCEKTPYFCLEKGRFVAVPNETTLGAGLSATLHTCLQSNSLQAPLNERNNLVNALIAYFQLHMSGFHNFTSHEILHTILK